MQEVRDMIELINVLLKFREDRDWIQFHSPKNLACSISIEANELLELFQWSSECKNIEKLKQEIADIGIYLLYLCNDMNINFYNAIKEKIEMNEKKYPVKISKGNSRKYNEL